MRSIFLSLALWFTCIGMQAQRPTLKSGPMVGYAQMKEVMLWAQTTAEADVWAEYWDKEAPDTRYRTATVRTRLEEAFTAHLLADKVTPGKHYGYAVYVNRKEVRRDYPLEFQTLPLWQWRSDPPAIRFAAGSCAYASDPSTDRPGTPYGAHPEIFGHIYEARPDFMVWLGDNVYYTEADQYSRTGIHYRYTHARAEQELQPLLGSVHHYAIWDDHDYGPNDADRSYILKDVSLEAFQLFWANPTYGLPGQPGITTRFEWGDLEFFMLDNRYFRAPNWRTTGSRTQIGEAQFEWLIDALKSSRATFKFVCIGGQVLNPFRKFETYANHFPEERKRLLEAIQREKIQNVVFLTGDRHHSELCSLEEGGVRILDLTVSPLTATPYDAESEENPLRLEGSHVGIRNFALLEVTGPVDDRELKIQIFDRENVLRYEHIIHPEK